MCMCNVYAKIEERLCYAYAKIKECLCYLDANKNNECVLLTQIVLVDCVNNTHISVSC